MKTTSTRRSTRTPRPSNKQNKQGSDRTRSNGFQLLQSRFGNHGILLRADENVSQPSFDSVPVSASHDPVEREAQNMARSAMAGSGPGASSIGDQQLPKRPHQVFNGSGRRLPAPVRSFFESRFGTDLGEVRIHTGNHAADLNERFRSRAFTYGNHVFLGPGQWNPGTRSGDELLAHELSHVIQQSTGTIREPRILRNGDEQPDRARLSPQALRSRSVAPITTRIRPFTVEAPIKARELAEIIETAQDDLNAIESTINNTVLPNFNQAFENFNEVLAEAAETLERRDMFYDALFEIAGSLLPVRAVTGVLGDITDSLEDSIQNTLTMGSQFLEGVYRAARAPIAGRIEEQVTGQLPSTRAGETPPAPALHETIEQESLRMLNMSRREFLRASINTTRLYQLLQIVDDYDRMVGDYEQGRMGEEEFSMVRESITRLSQNIRSINRQLDQQLTQSRRLGNRIHDLRRSVERNAQHLTRTRIEKWITVLWMGQLPDSDEDYLEPDVMEYWLDSHNILSSGYFGGSTLLGVEFGQWTSYADRIGALYVARRHVPLARAELNVWRSRGERE